MPLVFRSQLPGESLDMHTYTYNNNTYKNSPFGFDKFRKV